MEKLKNKLLQHHRRSRQVTPTPNNFRQWAVAFIVCNFNVDVGPEIEIVYPPNTQFSTSDLSAICFNSFPERQDTETAADLTFHFTIPNNSPDISLDSPCSPHGSATEFYGNAVFRQEYDHSMKRSFNQRTLVMITTHEFPAFFIHLLKEMTSSGVISDPTALETAHNQMLTWAPPSLGKHELPFMGSMLTLEITPHPAFPLQGLVSTRPTISATGRAPSIYAYEPLGTWENIMQFMPCLSDLDVVYEKLLLCESIIVLAKSPQLCSEGVSALVDLIRPIPYAGEVKPYMTMQSEFRSIGIDGGTPRPFIIGITNPFLLKRVLGASETSNRSKPHVLYLHASEDPVPIKRHRSMHHRNQSFDMPGGIDSQTVSKRFVKSDRTFVQTVDTLLRSSPANHELSSLIRRHYAELTAQYLAPVNRYLATSASTNFTSPGGDYRYANFSEADFLYSLSKHGSSMKFRGQSPMQRHKARDNLYESFCRSPNFYSWLDMKLGLEKEASAGLLSATPVQASPAQSTGSL
ncbi:uncharacterized protein BDZ99DRAFT_67964 [Mytilinidion resinicola]|uniref:UDENN domain-containing protein n=1 Tax=Mytilinidion resinicola TaxID=574789 RepID=A0A6A6YGF0_9PEZI|nr:uncharacterized protein BDZ99DRAFT_67964 [Mytilinidion resinicola]KAF2807881.1 hypothetical protein BDZ99DRAFT_67964 [Mytilinidion resinicola]